jgi:hypothetical protein
MKEEWAKSQNCYSSDIPMFKLVFLNITLVEWRTGGARRGEEFAQNFDQNTWREEDSLGDVDVRIWKLKEIEYDCTDRIWLRMGIRGELLWTLRFNKRRRISWSVGQLLVPREGLNSMKLVFRNVKLAKKRNLHAYVIFPNDSKPIFTSLGFCPTFLH